MGLSWTSHKLLTLYIMTYLLRNYILMDLIKIPEVLSNHTSRADGKGRKLTLRTGHGHGLMELYV